MFTSNWRCIIAAIGLAFVTLSGQAQDQTSSAQGQAEAGQDSSVTQMLPVPIEIIEDNEKAVARERREAEARQREIDDLIAQQGMNEATQAMNEATQKLTLYSLISTILVFLGTCVIVWSLFLARQANQFAFSAVKVTEKIGETSTRAWLTMGDPLLQGNSPDGKTVDTYLLVYPWQNTGPTPAREVKLYMDVSTKGELNLTQAVEKLSFDKQTYNVHPRSPGPSAMIDFTPKEILDSTNAPITIRFVAKYQTVGSGDERYAEACFNFRYNGPQDIRFLHSGQLDLAHFRVTTAKAEVVLT